MIAAKTDTGGRQRIRSYGSDTQNDLPGTSSGINLAYAEKTE